MLLLYCVAALTGRAQATPLVRRQNLLSKSHSKALPRRFNSRSPVQPTVVLDSNEVAATAKANVLLTFTFGTNYADVLRTRPPRYHPPEPHRVKSVAAGLL
jgi:hypothetical protein